MQAIEFTTTLQDGVVAIPLQYRSRWEGKAIRVIVLEETLPIQSSDEQSETTSSLFSRLKQIKIVAPPDFSENLDAYLNNDSYV